MPKAFLFTNKRYDLYNLNIPQPLRQQLSSSYNDEEKKESKDSKKNGTGTVAVVLDENQNDHAVDSNSNLTNLTCSSPKLIIDESSMDKNEIQIQTLTLYKDENVDYDDDYEEPVNLSLKKLDLFNLRQLAEVSISLVPDSTSSSKRIIPSQENPKNSGVYDSVQLTIIEEDGNTESTCSSTSSSTNIHNYFDLNSSSSSSASSTSSSSLSVSHNHNNHHQVIHECIECGKGYSTLSNLLRHRQTHRSTTDSNAIKTCPYCDKVYVSMPAFSMHLRTHNQGCKCPYCGKLFSRPWLLQGHIRTHTGEKPFECPSCNKKFADKSNLRAHTQTHSTDKPYVCSRCSKSFGLKSYLSKHIESSCMKSIRACNFNGNSNGNKISFGKGKINKKSKSMKNIQPNSSSSLTSNNNNELIGKNYKLIVSNNSPDSSPA